MPSVDRPLKIFFSSVMVDLDAERRVLERHVGRVPWAEYVGMERWSKSSDQSPRQRSLESLAECQVYVGIFGDRLGKMTVEEYRFAVKSGLPCLLFFREGAGRPGRLTRRWHVFQFRRRIENLNGHTIGTFRTPDELSIELLVALEQLRARRFSGEPVLRASSPEPSRFLATLCDRNRQQPVAEQLLDDALAGRHKIIVLGLVGPDFEEHHGFVDWYHYLRLRREFTARRGDVEPSAQAANYDNSRRHPLVIEWPSGFGTVEQRREFLLRRLGEQLLDQQTLLGPGDTLESRVEQAIRSLRQHITIRHTLHSASCSATDAHLLHRWLDFWAGMKLPVDGHIVTLFFCLRRSPRLIAPLLPSSWHLRTCWRTLERRQAHGFVCLPPLASPERLDALQWAEDRCIRYFEHLDVDELRRGATAPFKRWRRRVPFSEIRPALEAALQRANRHTQT